MKPTTESGKTAALRRQVFELSAELRRMVGKMLGQGISFEDAAAALNQRGYTGITVESVEIFYRAHPEIQQERIRYQLAVAQALKLALLDPESEQGQLADAALFTGLIDLSRRGVRFPGVVTGAGKERNSGLGAQGSQKTRGSGFGIRGSQTKTPGMQL